MILTCKGNITEATTGEVEWSPVRIVNPCHIDLPISLIISNDHLYKLRKCQIPKLFKPLLFFELVTISRHNSKQKTLNRKHLKLIRTKGHNQTGSLSLLEIYWGTPRCSDWLDHKDTAQGIRELASATPQYLVTKKKSMTSTNLSSGCLTVENRTTGDFGSDKIFSNSSSLTAISSVIPTRSPILVVLFFNRKNSPIHVVEAA